MRHCQYKTCFFSSAECLSLDCRASEGEGYKISLHQQCVQCYTGEKKLILNQTLSIKGIVSLDIMFFFLRHFLGYNGVNLYIVVLFAHCQSILVHIHSS